MNIIDQRNAEASGRSAAFVAHKPGAVDRARSRAYMQLARGVAPGRAAHKHWSTASTTHAAMYKKGWRVNAKGRWQHSETRHVGGSAVPHDVTGGHHFVDGKHSKLHGVGFHAGRAGRTVKSGVGRAVAPVGRGIGRAVGPSLHSMFVSFHMPHFGGFHF